MDMMMMMILIIWMHSHKIKINALALIAVYGNQTVCTSYYVLKTVYTLYVYKY